MTAPALARAHAHLTADEFVELQDGRYRIVERIPVQYEAWESAEDRKARVKAGRPPVVIAYTACRIVPAYR